MVERKKQDALSRSGDQVVRFPDRVRVTHKDIEGDQQIVIVIHGFTADASYLEQIMQDLTDDAVKVFAFEYACYRGIDTAAENLRHRISLLDRGGELSRSRVTLVGHSMGGLVARYLVCLLGGDKYVHTVITLGTPHQGTLKNSALLPVLIEWSHSVSSAAPVAFTPDSRSAKQLIGQDPAPTLLNRLNAARPPAQNVKFHSISGGYPKLEFGKGFIKDAILRHWIRGNLKEPHDGLVEEVSSDISSESLTGCFSYARHFKEYPEYSDTNHSNLVSNQAIALEVANIIACQGDVMSILNAAHFESPLAAPKDAH